MWVGKWGPETPGVGVTGPLIAPLQMERMRSRRCHHAPVPPVSLAPQQGSAPLAWDRLCRRGQWRGEGLPVSCLSPVCPLLLPAGSHPLGALSVAPMGSAASLTST